MNSTALLLLLGLGVGAFSGLIGIGGGILIVPALMFGFGFTQLRAQGTSTALLLPPIGVLAAYTYWKHDQVDVRAAALICAGFIVGGWFGAKFAMALPKEALRRTFGAVLVLIGAKFLIGR